MISLDWRPLPGGSYTCLCWRIDPENPASNPYLSTAPFRLSIVDQIGTRITVGTCLSLEAAIELARTYTEDMAESALVIWARRKGLTNR